MKILIQYLSCLVLLSITANVRAQIADPNAYLQSGYIEVGINQGGVYASDEPAPDYYHADSAYTFTTYVDTSYVDTVSYDTIMTYFDSVECLCWLTDTFNITTYITIYDYDSIFDTSRACLGIIFDSDMDGWNIGSPADYWGDVTIPGSPEEAFGIKADGHSYFNEHQNLDVFDIEGYFTGWDDTGDTTRAIWEGGIPAKHLTVKQETLLPDNKLYFLTRVTITNTGTEDIEDVYYVRNVDPDQEVRIGGSYATVNKVIYNNPDDEECLVSAEGEIFGNNYVMYGSRDARARVSYGGFGLSGEDIADIWHGESYYFLEGESLGDNAIQISFKIGNMAPLESTSFTFAYIFSDDPAVLEEALEKTLSCTGAKDVTTSDITNTSANISWTGSSPSMEYILEWKKAGASLWNSVTVEDNTYLLTALEICTDYEYRITTLCGDDIISDSFTFKTLCTDAVEDHLLSASVYPNPVKDGFTLVISDATSGEAKILITDAIGNIIIDKTIQAFSSGQYISMKDAPAGIYTVCVTQSGKKNYLQMVVSR